MNKVLFLFFGFSFSVSTLAVEIRFEGGGSAPVELHDQISEFEQMNRWYRYVTDKNRLIQQNRLQLQSGVSTLYSLPLETTENYPGYYGISNFVDQNTAVPDQLQDYNCGMRTYDLSNGYNHQGIDYFTWPFGWFKMDQDEVHVIAAEAGTITTKIDGNYDRSCGFDDPNNTGWNAVYITHADGSYAWYGHLKSGSLTDKLVGQTVGVGEYLGVVGSSGTSTGPHLHFETYDALDNLVEPHSGACNVMNDDSWWHNQNPYYNSRINQLITHAQAPGFLSCAEEGEETSGETEFFEYGDQVFLAAYYSDQLSSQTTTYQVINPSGTVVSGWDHASPVSHYAASYWYWSIQMPLSGGGGQWTFRAIYEGQQTDQTFWLNDIIFQNDFD